MEQKRLLKDPSNKVISGVCSGLGKYFGVDPTIIRIAWVIFSLLGGSGILAYIVCALLMPEETY